MPTPEEILAKSNATRLRNIRARQADNTPLSPQDKAFLKKHGGASKDDRAEKHKRKQT
jgi:hypothetical protein